MKVRKHALTRLARLCAGCCALMLYVFELTPVGIGLAAMLGTMDSDHRAALRSGATGMQLVLRHEGNCVGHGHHAIARALNLFAQPASATNPDHIVQFSSASSFMQESQPAIPVANQTEASAIVFTEPISLVTPKPDQFVPLPRPPPDIVANLLNVRSTVFLI